MSLQRRTLSATLKAKIALDAIREQETTAQLASRYGIHPTQIGKIKGQGLEILAHGFEATRSHASKDQEKLLERLYQKIGQLEVERDFLKKKSSLL